MTKDTTSGLRCRSHNSVDEEHLLADQRHKSMRSNRRTSNLGALLPSALCMDLGRFVFNCAGVIRARYVLPKVCALFCAKKLEQRHCGKQAKQRSSRVIKLVNAQLLLGGPVRKCVQVAACFFCLHELLPCSGGGPLSYSCHL